MSIQIVITDPGSQSNTGSTADKPIITEVIRSSCLTKRILIIKVQLIGQRRSCSFCNNRVHHFLEDITSTRLKDALTFLWMLINDMVINICYFIDIVRSNMNSLIGESRKSAGFLSYSKAITGSAQSNSQFLIFFFT